MRKLRFHIFTFLPFVAWPTDNGQNIYRIDAHIWEESAQEKIRLLSQSGAEKIAFLYFYISAFCSQTDGQNIYRIDSNIWEERAQKN